jgi:MFS family permease
MRLAVARPARYQSNPKSGGTRPMAGDHLDSPYSHLRLLLSMAAGTLTSVGMWAIVLVLPQIEKEFGVDRAGASFAYTAAMAGFGAGNLWLGRLVDRRGIAPVIGVAGIVIAAAFALSAAASSMWQVVALQTVIGFAAAAGFGPLIADLSHWFLRRRGIAVASAACGNYLAGALWPLLLKSTIEADGWRTAFLTIAAILAVGVLPLAWSLRRRAPVADGVLASAAGGRAGGDLGLSPATLQGLLMVAGLACCMAMAMPQVHLVAYCADLGYGIVAGAEMVSLMLAGGVVSRLASGMIADRIGGILTLLAGSVLQCLALFLYIPFDGLASLYVVSAVFGLAQGGIVPCYAIIVREYLPAREAGERVGIVILATVVGMAAGGWMSGWIYDLTGSYRAAFLNGIAWNLLNIAVMTFLLARAQARPALA